MRRLLLAAFLAAASASAETGALDLRPLVARGRVELSVGGGWGAFNAHDYLLLLLGGGYYLRDGLSAGLTGEAWLGSSPQIYALSPHVRDVLLDVPWRYKPYVGAFYRRTAYSRDFKPLDSSGASAGLVFPLSPRAYATAGLVYERYFRCDPALYTSCGGTYPEIGLQFSF